MKRIAGYYRLSVEDDVISVESNSIANQRLFIKSFIEKDEELSKNEFCEFYDDGYSGTTMNRPGMQALLELVKKNEIDVVVVKDLSRFSRDYIDLGTYMEQIFPFMGIRFIAIADHYDSRDYEESGVGIDVAFQGLLSDFYCKDISEKVKSSLSTRRRQGKYATGLTPFGYEKKESDPYELQIVPEEAEIVCYIFKLSFEGNNLTQICRKLNEEKILTPLEYRNQRKKQNRKELQQQYKLWQAGTVKAILTNETYIGNMIYEKTRQELPGTGKKIVLPREEWKAFENHHEPIVEKDIFNEVQKKFGNRKTGSRKSIEYPLKGKLYCGHCKRTLKVMKLAGEKLFFYCSSKNIMQEEGCLRDSLSNEVLEKIVVEEIQRQIGKINERSVVLKELRQFHDEEIRKQRKEIMELEKEMQRLTELKRKLLEDYHEGILNAEEYFEKRKKIIVSLEEMQEELERKKSTTESQCGWKKGTQNEMETLLKYSRMEILNKEMVRTFVEKIEVDGDRNVDIYWKSRI